jgi:hypothetical protein
MRLIGSRPSSYERSLIPARGVPLTLGDLSQFRGLEVSPARYPAYAIRAIQRETSAQEAGGAQSPPGGRRAFPEELVLLRQAVHGG